MEASSSGWEAALHALLRLKTASVTSGGSMNDSRSHRSFTQLTTDWTMVRTLKGCLCIGSGMRLGVIKTWKKVEDKCEFMASREILLYYCKVQCHDLSNGSERALLNF